MDTRTTALAAGAFVALGLCATAASAQSSSPIACDQVAKKFVGENTLITSSAAAILPASGSDPAVAYCDVRGTVNGHIKFAVFLPTATWNGRFQMVGNGGKAGVISFDAMRSAIRMGYASSSTDTGHDNTIAAESGSKFGNDAVFGKEREIDFGYRSVHVVSIASKGVIQTYYGKGAAYSYWNGCSTGGRQGMMETQRYPDDFDGYVIGAPVYDYTGAQMNAPARLAALYSAIPPKTPADGPFISPAKRDMIGNVIYNGLGDFKGCDVEDGLKDGQIRNPYACSFDIDKHVPACSGPSDTSVCLTPAERTAFKKLYAGREPFVPGAQIGSENIPGGWSTWLIPNSPTGTPLLNSVVGDSMEWLMFNPDRPGFNYFTQFDWNTDPFLMDEAAKIFSATNPDMSYIRSSGKKIIMYHGYQDPAAQPIRSIRYRQAVIDKFAEKYGNGRTTAAGEALTNQFLRLFMVPGMAHCGDGVGHSNVDWVTPLARWVEQDEPPKAIVGTKPGTTSTRPHCPYPQVAVYDGKGDPTLAESFACKAPSK